MFHSRHLVSRRFLFAVGLLLCTLPGCGGSGSATARSSSLPAIIPARSITQSFPELSASALIPPPAPSTSLASSAASSVTPSVSLLVSLQAPIDQTKPLVVTSGSVPLVQGKDYTVDSAFPDTLHVNYASPNNTTLTVQYTSLPTTMQVFFLNSGSQTKFTLARPVDLSKMIRIQLHPSQPTSTPVITLTAQEYTLDPNNPVILQLAQAPTTPTSLAITYVPLAQ